MYTLKALLVLAILHFLVLSKINVHRYKLVKQSNHAREYNHISLILSRWLSYWQSFVQLINEFFRWIKNNFSRLDFDVDYSMPFCFLTCLSWRPCFLALLNYIIFYVIFFNESSFLIFCRFFSFSSHETYCILLLRRNVEGISWRDWFNILTVTSWMSSALVIKFKILILNSSCVTSTGVMLLK